MARWFSLDHKVIGLQYAVTSMVFLLVGFGLMMLLRWQLAYPMQPIPLIGRFLGAGNVANGIMLPEFYNQLGAMHGTIHSFGVPAMRVKQDAIPGMTIPVWFTPTLAGTFDIACSQLCGLGHYRMRGVITVERPEEFTSWLAPSADPAPGVRSGIASRDGARV